MGSEMCIRDSPDTDILDILYAVLESARLKPYSLEDTEAEYKEDMNKYASFLYIHHSEISL